MQKDTRSLIWGIILIIIGFLFLGSNLDWFSFYWGDLWPSALILGGLFFWIGWLFNRKEYGLLMPGTILIVYGIMFQYSALNGWYYMDENWPGFLLGPGLGFLFMYLLGDRNKGLLIPAFILIGLASIFWFDANFQYIWPLVLIAVGIYLLFKNRFGSSEQAESVDQSDENKPIS
jgi:hypothetical protein